MTRINNTPAPIKHGNAFKDISGRKSGKLTAIEFVEIGRTGKSRWLCLCDCGNTTIVESTGIVRGSRKSCGCLPRKPPFKPDGNHSQFHMAMPEWSSWNALIGRCDNPTDPYYGGRGVKVCDYLRNSFINFKNLVGPKPAPAFQIDRINNDLHYSCGSCEMCQREGWKLNIHWASPSRNSRNRRNTVWLTFDGRTKTLCDWAEEKGIEQVAIRSRLARKWPVEKILSIPPKKRTSRLIADT